MVLLGIILYCRGFLQDYFDVVRQPMDLSTIREKLKSGEYSDPWECINDIQLMFDNAWLYNRKTSKVYKYCSKVIRLLCVQIMTHNM